MTLRFLCHASYCVLLLNAGVSKTRDNYRFLKEGKKSRLKQEQIQQLESIGFQWFVGKGKGLRTWEMYFRDLLKFKEKHGHYNVPLNYEDNSALATWAHQQRINYRNEQMGKCKYARQVIDHNKRLAKIGFNFHADEFEIVKRKKRKTSSKDEDAEEKAGGPKEGGEEEERSAKRTKSNDDNDAVDAGGAPYEAKEEEIQFAQI